MRFLVLLTLLATLLHGLLPASALGGLAGCEQEMVQATNDSTVVSACCAKHATPERHDEESQGPCKDNCHSCLCCKVVSNSVTGLARHVATIRVQDVVNVLATDEVRYLGIATIPAVPPPRA